ncbi:MAG: hypothetical protein IZT59_02690 [Verrucomicrobia bacterium]|jgi:hypothetical protein|nr:hypothetical protein [Verrucomicrobiota bacterium]|tara:strand:+ start:2366 stop:2548 length:183 start_codon:yes stop_codon:yes gene_type:complete
MTHAKPFFESFQWNGGDTPLSIARNLLLREALDGAVEGIGVPVEALAKTGEGRKKFASAE